MRNTLRHTTAACAVLITLAMSTTAMASAGGRYDRSAPAPTAQEPQAAAEASSKHSWEELSEQVPDLDQAAATKSGPEASSVRKAKDVADEPRVCTREAKVGGHIKRRVCRTEREVRARKRSNKILREALLRYRMYQ